MISSFSADKSALERKYSNNLSDTYFERFSKFYLDWQSQLEAVDFESLTKDQKVDYVLLRNKIEKSIYFHGLATKEFDEVKFVVQDAKDIYVYNENRKSGLIRMQRN
jgi:hypothetical protein